jgi:hypothetical protein
MFSGDRPKGGAFVTDSTYEKWIAPEKTNVSSVSYGGGDGTSLENACVISEPVHLMKLSEDVNNGFAYGGFFFRLGADIDLGGASWRPIGYSAGPFDKREFAGVVDGCGHTVRNFKIENQNGKSAGLFGYIEYAVIQNLYVRDFVVSGGESAGGVAGYSETSTIASCYAEGRIESRSANVGGIVGLACNSMIMNSVSAVSIDAAGGAAAGGLCGYAYNGTKMYNCESRGALRASDVGDAGGFVGSMRDGYIENCHADISVAATDCGNIGGFGGIIRNCRLDWCGSKGSVNAINENTNSLAGGFAGFTNSVITRSISSGPVTKNGPMGAVGGFAGDIVKGSVYYSYSSGDVTGEGIVGGFAGSANSADDIVTTIENCYCSGDVTSRENKSVAGGFIGNIRRLGGNVVISKCYSYGVLSSKTRGFTVRNSVGSVVDCVWRRDEGGVNDDVTDGRGIASLSTERFAGPEAFAALGWNVYDAESVWCFPEEITPARPHLNGLPIHK